MAIRKQTQKKTSVAVIGSGMAGLVTAYLIQQDSNRRFEVEVFETQDQLSLDSASTTITPVVGDASRSPYRIDLPMRAFDGNFHRNLKRMYDYLGIKYNSPEFIYPLSTLSASDGKKLPPHFIHSSSNHQIPPIRPEGLGLVKWVLEIGYLALCYFWFTVCCFLVASKADESLRQYLVRIRLPVYFSKTYLLPLMSSITTCPHDALLDFPATDGIEYARRTYRQPHYTVVGGVQNVQSKISKGQVVRLGATVTAVENIGTRVRITWTESKNKTPQSKEFDHVIMAVTPNVVGAIYQPLRKLMNIIPVVVGESVVHRDASVLPNCGQSIRRFQSPTARPSHDQPQILYICSDASATESIHEHPSSILVTNFPISPIDPSKVIHRARLTRVLRTPRSRAAVNRIFAIGKFDYGSEEKGLNWRNGDGNVWLVGAWCWDGMVLLEGCVVSAMRVARDLGVEVPWGNDDFDE